MLVAAAVIPAGCKAWLDDPRPMDRTPVFEIVAGYGCNNGVPQPHKRDGARHVQRLAWINW